ncbi:hypothetical protein P5V15_002079 [Pogonomyrmex californicus]
MTASSGSPLPKWQLALVLGAPVAIGLGYMYYRNRNNDNSSKPGRDKYRSDVTAKEKNGAPADKQISIDGDCPPKVPSPMAEPETPLQKAQRYKNEGNVYFKTGKYDKAIAQYNKAIDICPKENVEDLATFYQNRAAAYEQLKSYSAVKADCTKALELNPKYAKALLRRARASEQIGDLETALEDVTIACYYEAFTNNTSLSMADKILEKLGKQSATENLKNKKFIMPSKHFIKSYIMSFPNDPVFSRLQHLQRVPKFFMRPLQALIEMNYDDVIPLCNEVIQNPEFNTLPSSKIEVLLLRATFYLLLGEHQAAMEDFESILNNTGTSDNVKINALIKRAAFYMQTEKLDNTFEDFDAAIRLNPEYSDIYYHRGQINLFMNRINEAKSDFEKAVYYNPNFGIAYAQKCYMNYRSAILNRDEELAEMAMADFEKTFDMYPNPPEYIHCHIMYAEMMAEAGQFEKADAYFDKAIREDPENAIIYVQKGLLQLQWKEDVDKAVKYIHKALEVDEKCELAYESLGSIEVRRGNLEEAIRLFDKALIFCRTRMELKHIYSLRYAAKTQLNIKRRLGMDVNSDLRQSTQFNSNSMS